MRIAECRNGNVEIRESGTEAAGWRIFDFGLPIGDWAEAEFRKLNVESGKAGNGGDGISEGRIWNSGNQERKRRKPGWAAAI